MDTRKHKSKSQRGYLWSDRYIVELENKETPSEPVKDALRIATGCGRKEVEEWQKDYIADNYN